LTAKSVRLISGRYRPRQIAEAITVAASHRQSRPRNLAKGPKRLVAVHGALLKKRLMVGRAIASRLASTAWNRVTLRYHATRRAQLRLDKLAERRVRFLICIPYLKSGGGEKVAANLAHAFAHLYGPDSCAVLVTDWNGLVVRLVFPENVFNNYPDGVPIVDVVALRRLPHQQRLWELMTAIMSMRPEMVFNVNSDTMWQCYERFAPEMSRRMRLGTVAFVHVGDKDGKPVGYTATHLERLLPFLDFVVTDNKTIIRELGQELISIPATEHVLRQTELAAAKLLTKRADPTKRETRDIAQYLGCTPSRAEWTAANLLAHQITATNLETHDLAKFRCLYQFTALTCARVSPLPNKERRPQILWASRVTRVKFPELLPRIARLLPDCDIHAYGAREVGYRYPAVKSLMLSDYDLGERLEKAPNLFWRGPYKSFADLPLARFDAMLYTGLYDGLPNVLLEAAANRIPIVAPTTVGGIAELINDDSGWPVDNPYDPRAYAECLRDVLRCPQEADKRADALVHVIARRHSFEAFCGAVRELVEARSFTKATAV
jgi:glycosyltransferase involved in cell wall biosynthesis